MQTVRVRTTQNVYIDHPVASIGDRILAYLIDRIILILYTVAFVSLLIQLNVTRWYVWFLLLGIPWLFYSLAFEILMNGQSPGKRVMNIQVVQLNGAPPTIGNYLFRWIFAFVDFYIMSGAVAVACIALGGKGQRIGDMVAGTSVVKLTKQEEITGSDIFITPEDAHVPSFAQVTQLTDREIEIIQSALDAKRTQGNDRPVVAITEKVKDMLNIQSDLPAEEFLRTIVKDYGMLMSGRL